VRIRSGTDAPTQAAAAMNKEKFDLCIEFGGSGDRLSVTAGQTPARRTCKTVTCDELYFALRHTCSRNETNTGACDYVFHSRHRQTHVRTLCRKRQVRNTVPGETFPSNHCALPA
jgi:hypothetical protein